MERSVYFEALAQGSENRRRASVEDAVFGAMFSVKSDVAVEMYNAGLMSVFGPDVLLARGVPDVLVPVTEPLVRMYLESLSVDQLRSIVSIHKSYAHIAGPYVILADGDTLRPRHRVLVSEYCKCIAGCSDRCALELTYVVMENAESFCETLYEISCDMTLVVDVSAMNSTYVAGLRKIMLALSVKTINISCRRLNSELLEYAVFSGVEISELRCDNTGINELCRVAVKHSKEGVPERVVLRGDCVNEIRQRLRLGKRKFSSTDYYALSSRDLEKVVSAHVRITRDFDPHAKWTEKCKNCNQVMDGREHFLPGINVSINTYENMNRRGTHKMYTCEH
jgi:hypothetical protein